MRLMLSLDLINALDRLIAYYQRRTGARGALPRNALLSFAPSAAKREQLNRASGYRLRTIPFDRRLNAL